MPNRYSISKLDPIDAEDVEAGLFKDHQIGECGWFPFATAIGWSGLWVACRELRRRGYSDVSILVEKQE